MVKAQSTPYHDGVMKKFNSTAHLEAVEQLEAVEGWQPERCSKLCLAAAVFVWEVLLMCMHDHVTAKQTSGSTDHNFTLMRSKVPFWQSLLKELRLAVTNVEGCPLGSMYSNLPRQPQRQACLCHKLMLQEGCTGGPLCRILHSSMKQGS